MLFSFVASGENPNFHLQSLKRPPPKTPDKCDPDLSFDAVTELQQEVVFFKDRCVFSKEYAFFFLLKMTDLLQSFLTLQIHVAKTSQFC